MIYQHKLYCIGLLEEFSRQGLIELFYADESHFSQDAPVPYGWQFKDEAVFMPSSRGKRLNCFAGISRNNNSFFSVTEAGIDSSFIASQLDHLSRQITKPTVVVLDNASVHTAATVTQRIPGWQKRELFLFYLPRYSPHLNIAETLWRILKYHWLRPDDYFSFEKLRYSLCQALANLGHELCINFSDFSLN